MKGFDEYYDEAVEPGKRERAFAWATAIGLQDVDGLKPSKYLLKTAKRHIEGEITAAEARRLVDEYYETKLDHDAPADAKEADKVSARIIAIVNMPGFRLSPEYFIGLHRQIFDGVFPHAGKLREVQLTKKEWVLNGDTVEYAPYFDIDRSLEYDFEKEKKFRYAGLSDDAKVAHFAAFISGIWQIHPFREGNTRTTGLFAIKYLQSRGYEVTNDLFYKKSWYFRNALVRANYENSRRNVEKTLLPLEEFFKVLLFGEEIELKNRFLRIGSEHGSSVATAVTSLHRRGKNSDVGINPKQNDLNQEQSGQSRQEPITNTSEPITKIKWCPENDNAMARHRRDLRERAKNIWERLAENPDLTVRGLSLMLRYSLASTQGAINALKESKLLVKEGGTKGRKWIVKTLRGGGG